MSPVLSELTSEVEVTGGQAKDDARRFQAKWGQEVERHGFTAVPNVLLRANLLLGPGEKLAKSLSAIEFLVLIQLLSMWWDAYTMPFPSKRLLSELTGLSERQIQRILTKLRKRGLLTTITRIDANGRRRPTPAYNLGPLKEFAESLVRRIDRKNQRVPK